MLDLMLANIGVMCGEWFPEELCDLVENLLDNLNITQSGNWVIMTYQITIPEIEDIMEAVQAMLAEAAHQADRDSIQAAVTDYWWFSGGGDTDWPTADGTIPGDVDFSLLIDGGYLTEEPASSVGVGGSYTWQIDSQGLVTSDPAFDGTYP